MRLHDIFFNPVSFVVRLLPALICILFFINALYGQQTPQHSLYMVDKYNINPAYGGLDRSLSANFNYRNQWQGVDQNPEHLYVNAHLPVYIINGGAGLRFFRDRTGAITSTGAQLSYNYVQPTPGGLLSAGIRAGIKQSRIDGSRLITPDGIYDNGIFSHEDPILAEGIMDGISMDWTVGVFVGHDLFDLGLTFSNFALTSTPLDDFTLDQSQNFTVFGQLPLLLYDFEIYPSFLLKSNLKSFQSDLSCLVKNGSIFGGMSLRGFNEKSLESLVILGGLRVSEHYTLSYSYDIGLGPVRNVSQGSHEINLNYNLNKRIGIGLPPDIMYNPRNL